MITKRLLVFMITLCLLSSFSYAVWWNASWEYKQPINISNRARDLTDYQVRFYISNATVGNNFNWSNGGKDLRFLNSTETGLYNYWIEKWNVTSETATIYIKISGIFTNNTNKIVYMYYGNNAATKASTTSILTNLDEDAERSYARQHFGTGSELVAPTNFYFERNSTIVKNGSYSFKMNMTSGNYVLLYMNNTWTNTTNSVLELAWWAQTSGDQDFIGVCFNFDPVTVSGYCAAHNSNADANNNWRTRFERYDDGVVTEVYTGGVYPGDRFEWTRVVTRMNSQGSWNTSYFNSAGVLLVTETLSGHNVYQTGGIALWGYIGLTTPKPIYYDSILWKQGDIKETQLALPLMGTVLGSESNLTGTGNTAPTIIAYLLPTVVYYNETLYAQCNGTDIDLDNLTYNYWLYENGTLMFNGSTTKTSVYNVTNLTANTVWQLNCTAYDGNATSVMDIETRQISFPWWNINWTYKQKITLKNRASSTITDYEFRVDLNNLNTEATFNWSNSGKDLRFISENNTVVYKYWIEKWNSTTEEATIYVDVIGSLAPNISKTIYMYYGNPSAITNTTISAINTFFEDAERSYVADHFYKLTINSSNLTRTTEHWNDSYSLKLDATPGVNTLYIMNNSWTNTTGNILELEYWGRVKADGGFVGLCFNFDPVSVSGYCASFNDNVGILNWRSRLDVWVNGSIYYEFTDLYGGNRQNWTRVISKINTNIGSWNVTYYNYTGVQANKSVYTNANFTLFKEGSIGLYGYSRAGFPSSPIYFDGMKLLNGWAYETQLILPTPNVTLGLVTSQQQAQGENTVPVAYASFTPAIIYTNNTLRAYCNSSDVDVDENISYSYWIYRNDVLITNATTGYYSKGTQINIYNNSILDFGDTWQLNCRAYDSKNYSTISTAYTVIRRYNTAPIINYANISPTYPTIIDNLLGYCKGTDSNNDKLLYDWKWYVNGSLYRDNIEIIYNEINITESTTWYHDIQYKDGKLYVVDATIDNRVYIYLLNGSLYQTIIPNYTDDAGPIQDWGSIEYNNETDEWLLYYASDDYLHIFDNTWNETSKFKLNTGECSYGIQISNIMVYNNFIYVTHYNRPEITKHKLDGTCIGVIYNSTYNNNYDIQYYDGFFYALNIDNYNNTIYVYDLALQPTNIYYIIPNLSGVGWYGGFDIYNNILYIGSYQKYVYGFNFSVKRDYLNTTVNVDNISSTITNLDDDWTLYCRAFDGYEYTNWVNDTVNIGSTLQIVTLNITPQYPIKNVDDINCSFTVNDVSPNPVNVTVSWFNSTNLVNWYELTAYDYIYQNITKGNTYITNVGTGSIPNNIYHDYTHWKCEITVTVSGSTLIQNSSIINVYPTENLTIYSPANNTVSSSNILSTTFSVIDYDGLINCSLNVNNSKVDTNSSTVNGTITTLDYIMPTNDYYTWFIECNSRQNNEYVRSGYYNYLYDNTVPTFSNYYNSTTPIYPQVGDIVNISVDVADNFEVRTCKLQIKDDDTGWRNETTFIINNATYGIDTTFTVRNVSTSDNSIVNWSFWCNDSTGNKIVSSIKYFNVSDVTLPYIINSPSNVFYGTNETIISGRLYDLYYNFTYFDYNLFQAEVNITCDVNGQIHYWTILNITTSNFTIVNSTDLEGLPPQRCTIFTAASDDHTKRAIPNYEVTDLTKGLKIKTEHNNIVSLIDNDLTIDDSISATKQRDRYKFDMNFKNKKLLLNYTIVSNNPIYFRRDSSFPAHFVIWNENISAGNWIDFNVKKVNNQEGNIKNKDRNYRITRISDYEYNVLIMPDIPLDEINDFTEGVDDIFTFNFSTRENRNLISKYGISDIEFESIGGTTITNASYGFYIGGDVNISTLNVYDNGTYINNFTLQITTLNSYPGFNGTFVIAGNNETLENISNGSYRLDFSHGRYFSRSYIINIVNSSQDIVYRTFQSVVFAYARNVKTFVPVYGTYGTANNTVTNFITNEANYDNTTEYLDFYLNASIYNLTFVAPGYLPFNDSFTLTYKQNLTLTYNLSFYVDFYFVDERTLEGFNMSSPDTIRFILYCTSSTYTTVIPPSNTSQATGIPINCNYDKFKFVLEYPATSYYRTLIYPSSYFNNSFNITVYLIDLRTTTAVVNTFILDDLLQQYDNPSIYIKKIINDASELITSDFIDIENKITAYLIQNHEYIIEVWSDNNPIRTIGTYAADSAGDKIIRVYDIDLEAEASGIVNNVYTAIVNMSINGSPYIVATYYDEENLTTSVTFNVYTNGYNQTLIYTNTVPGAYEIEFLYNYSAYINDTLYPEIVYNYPGRNPIRVVKQINVQGFRINLPIMQYISTDFMGWFLTIVLSILAIMATAKTANVVTLVLLGFSALFIVFGWYPLAWGMWAVILFIALLVMFKEGEKTTT